MSASEQLSALFPLRARSVSRAERCERRSLGPLSRALIAAPKLTLAGLDVLAVSLALAAAVTTSARFGPPNFEAAPSVLASVLTVLVFPVALRSNRLYSSRCITRGADELRRILSSVAVGMATLTVLTVFLQVDTSRLWLVEATLFSTAALLTERVASRRLFRSLRARGHMMRRVVVVGANREAEALCAMFEADRALGYEVVGVVDDTEAAGVGPLSVVGPVESTLSVVRSTGASGVVMATTALDLDSSNRLIRSLTEQGVHVELSSSLRDIAAQRLVVKSLGRFPVVYIEPAPRDGWRAIAKRSFDVVIASLLLVVTFPVLALAALAIKLDSRGSVLFRQKRVGRYGEVFEVLKLRTMVEGAEAMLLDLVSLNEADAPLFKLTRDPRVTRVGRILRRTSIDELPQLWNVIRGEMSMVGPRPALQGEMELWSDSLHDRLQVHPGITGAWQVNGRSESRDGDYERLDLYYVDNWSLLTDLAILAKTVPAVLLRRGAH